MCTLPKAFLKWKKSRWNGDINSECCYIKIRRVLMSSLQEKAETTLISVDPVVFRDSRKYVDTFSVVAFMFGAPPQTLNDHFPLSLIRKDPDSQHLQMGGSNKFAKISSPNEITKVRMM